MLKVGSDEDRPRPSSKKTGCGMDVLAFSARLHTITKCILPHEGVLDLMLF